MGPRGIARRDEGLHRVGRITGWLGAGAIALTALASALAAVGAPGGGSRSAQPQVSAPAAAPSVNPVPSDPGPASDPRLVPLPAPTSRRAPPPNTSSRGS